MSHRNFGFSSQRSRPEGFTLVELLVAIAIIAVLASLLLPALGRAKQEAIRLECRSNQRQLALGIELYHGDNEWYPRQLGGPNGASTGNNLDDGWINKIFEGSQRRRYGWHNTYSRAIHQYEAPYFCRNAAKAFEIAERTVSLFANLWNGPPGYGPWAVVEKASAP